MVDSFNKPEWSFGFKPSFFVRLSSPIEPKQLARLFLPVATP